MVEKQNVSMWTKTGAVLGFVTWIIGWAWHGFLGYPSMMGYMMGFEGSIGMWSMMTSVYLLPVFLIGGAFYGWLFATAWNWIAKQ